MTRTVHLTFRQILARLLVPAIVIGLAAPALEGRFTPSGIAKVMAVTVCIALLTGAFARWMSHRQQARGRSG
jgi:hypothetical protein